MVNKNKDKDPELEISQKELQELIETLDPKRNIQDLAASAAEIIASAGFSTQWDDILPMLDDEHIQERLRLAAHIIFRARLVLEEMEKHSSLHNIVYNTMLMMDALKVANIKGYIPPTSEVNFKKMKAETSTMDKAIKKEKIIDTIRQLAKENPDKGITWLRKRASTLLSSEKDKGYSYRQIQRDTKGMRIRKD
ncbi:MAG: hypothetical protein QF895_03885 [SAR86 cluster bacterium]|nr:hypothetical protein [SAR86 cluster bacterium]